MVQFNGGFGQHSSGVSQKRLVSWLGVTAVHSLPKQMLSGYEWWLTLTVAGPHRTCTGFPFQFTSGQKRCTIAPFSIVLRGTPFLH